MKVGKELKDVKEKHLLYEGSIYSKAKHTKEKDAVLEKEHLQTEPETHNT